MSETRRFHIGDVLSITDGHLLSPTAMSGVHKICDWLAGEPVWTHQLMRVADEARPVLYHFFPELHEIEFPEGLSSEEAIAEWLSNIVEQYGEFRDVPQLSRVEHASIDPVLELQNMVGADRVIPVVRGEP